MSSIIRGAEKKIEIWIIGQTDVYSLEAKTKKAKEDFANELRRVIIEQKDKAGIKTNSNNPGTGKQYTMLPERAMFFGIDWCLTKGYNEYNISNSGSESMRSRHSNNSGNDHLEPRSQSSGELLEIFYILNYFLFVKFSFVLWGPMAQSSKLPPEPIGHSFFIL